MVVTFREHPRCFLDGAPKLLTTPAERERLLLGAGVQAVLMLDFAAVQQQTAEQFMQYLRETYAVTVLLMGYDHRFGSDRLYSFAAYVAAGQHAGVEVVLYKEYQQIGQHVSSTAIRKALADGDAEKANALLGYSYTLAGQVVSGKQIGRELGFPTANIELSNDKLIPKAGVWVVRVGEHIGLLNIGTNPTVGGEKMSVEVHILDYAGDLYGQELALQLLHYIRAERRFESRAELQKQIEKDVLFAKSNYL